MGMIHNMYTDSEPYSTVRRVPGGFCFQKRGALGNSTSEGGAEVRKFGERGRAPFVGRSSKPTIRRISFLGVPSKWGTTNMVLPILVFSLDVQKGSRNLRFRSSMGFAVSTCFVPFAVLGTMFGLLVIGLVSFSGRLNTIPLFAHMPSIE